MSLAIVLVRSAGTSLMKLDIVYVSQLERNTNREVRREKYSRMQKQVIHNLELISRLFLHDKTKQMIKPLATLIVKLGGEKR